MDINVNNLKLDEKTIERFFKKIKKRKYNCCWNWKFSKTTNGYGVFRLKNKNFGAHRISYLIHFGNFDKNKCILHKCDNPSCVNPEHLMLGSQLENMQDMTDKKRRKFGHLKGEQHGKAKLSNLEVLCIKKMLAAGVYQKEIAKKYNISQVAVSLIKRNINWKCLSIGNINE